MSNLAGLLKHKITLQQRHDVTDIYGGVVSTWADGPALYARVHILKGDEEFDRLGLPQTAAGVHARIKIRRRNGLSPAMNRVKHGPVLYDILAVLQDVDNKETHLLCLAREIDQNGGPVNP